jgi:leucyl-tRNA synthetase
MAKKRVERYIPSDVEGKWQEKWRKSQIYAFDENSSGEVYYNLVELPYPSGDLHIGHWFTFTTADIHARYQRMAGKNVFFPNGFDAFGLPAENAAIKRGIHPQDWTLSNIETMKKQFETMGTMIDWSHEAITCLPEYYRWNQWIFIKMFERGLAYRGKAMSNWCPSCQTVLANEGIEDGKCWRCGSEVVQKEISQWFLKITEYADRLLWENTDQKISNNVNWPQSVREGQNNWIGRSEGAEVDFAVEGLDEEVVTVFTTRPDTLFGATFLVLAPEHKIVAKLLAESRIKNQELSIVKNYVDQVSKKTEMERKEQKEKTGVFTGAYAINPINSQRLPIWIADYVLGGYGTGAIMAVPGHDERDHAFATKYDLPIVQVINGEKTEDVRDVPYEGDGVLVNSGKFDGQTTTDAQRSITKYLQSISKGRSRIVYHLRDWSISRQRYWGTPIPIIYCRNCWDLKTENFHQIGGQAKLKSEYGNDFIEIDGVRHAMVLVRQEDLPVELPYEVDYTPKGEPPLATAKEWVNVLCPKCGGEARRDTETMDTFFDSSWYYYRYLSPKYEKGPFDLKLVEKIMPVDIYYGGSEHTLGHTLYARFFTKFFHDLGLVTFDEFAKKRIQHGVILGPDGYRMSKSRGNVVNPDDVVREYGTDTVRMYLAFMIPFEATAPWNTSAISGISRFLRRVWELQDVLSEVELSQEDRVQMARTIKQVGDDAASIHFNTAIARMMEWLNYLSRKKAVSKVEYKAFVQLLAPFAPHFAEELWHRYFGKDSVHKASWPTYNEADLVEESVTIVLQVNGKMRDSLVVSQNTSHDQAAIEELALVREKVKKYTDAKKLVKTIFIPGRAINFVVV